MSMEGNFEKTRIQDPDKAHEIANMMSVEAGERPTAQDYDQALATLEELQAEMLPPSVEKVVRPLRDIALIIGSLSESAQDLIAWSLISMIPGLKDGDAGGKLPKERLIEVIKGMKFKKDYDAYRSAIMTAREKLEMRREKAEELAKNQTKSK